ncbi:hypothetical protein ABK040_011593 [Willaertia magna]
MNSQQLGEKARHARFASMIGGILMIIVGVSSVVFASTLLITHTHSGWFATILGSFSIPAIVLDYLIGVTLTIAGVLSITSSVMLSNIKKRYQISYSALILIGIVLLLCVIRIGLTIGVSIHIHTDDRFPNNNNNNNNNNQKQQQSNFETKKNAYIISIVLSCLGLIACCFPFLGCSIYQVTTLYKLIILGGSSGGLLEKDGNNNLSAPYVATDDIPLMKADLEDDEDY